MAKKIRTTKADPEQNENEAATEAEPASQVNGDRESGPQLAPKKAKVSKIAHHSLSAEVQEITGPPPNNTYAWGLHRIDRATGIATPLEWDSGDGVNRKDWPLEELKPEVIRSRWGSGVFRIWWRRREPETGKRTTFQGRELSLGPAPGTHGAGAQPGAIMIDRATLDELLKRASSPQQSAGDAMITALEKVRESEAERMMRMFAMIGAGGQVAARPALDAKTQKDLEELEERRRKDSIKEGVKAALEELGYGPDDDEPDDDDDEPAADEDDVSIRNIKQAKKFLGNEAWGAVEGFLKDNLVRLKDPAVLKETLDGITKKLSGGA